VEALMTDQEQDTDSEPSKTSAISIFGPPPLVDGEDERAYDNLLTQLSSAVKPTDIIEEIYIHDVVDLTWEILRWRRIKISLVEKGMRYALAQTLKQFFPKRRSEAEKRSLFPDFTPSKAATKLAKKWDQRDPVAIEQVNKLLSSVNTTIDAVAAGIIIDKLDHIERVDRLVTIAEGRRNAIFREIDRHRMTFAQALRGNVRAIENVEFEAVEPKTIAPTRDQNAA
jgi:hypothetical protein